MKQYISHFSIDRQGKVTPNASFDASQFEVQFDENEQAALTSEIANAIDDAVSSHVNNKLEFIGQNIHNIFNDCFSRIESHLGMKPIGSDNNASTSNNNKTMNDSANCKTPTNVLVINSANQRNRINYNSAPHVNVPHGAASSLQHSTPPNFAQHHGIPNRPMAEILGPAVLKMK